MAHNDTNGARTVAEWARDTDWAEVLAGADLDPAARWHGGSALDLDADGRLVWHEPDPEHDDDPEAEPVTSVVAADERLELVDGATPPEWWPVIDGQPADKLTAYAGVRGRTRAEAAKALGLNDDVREWRWFFDLPGLEPVRDAALKRGASMWGVLGAALAITLGQIDPRAVLAGDDTDLWGAASLNLYVLSVAESGKGKGSSVKAAKQLVKWDDMRGGPAAMIVPEGTPEGIARMLSLPKPKPTATKDDDGKKITVVPELTPADIEAHIAGNKFVGIFDEAIGWTGQARTEDARHRLERFFNSAFMGEAVGMKLADDHATRDVPEHSYRYCVHASAQEPVAFDLMSKTLSGFSQRFLVLPATPLHADFKDPRRVTMRMPELYLNPRIASVTGNIVYPDYVTAELMALQEKQLFGDDDGSNMNSYRGLIRVKVAVGLNAMLNGEVGIEPRTWAMAGVVMEASDATRDGVLARQREAARQRELAEVTDRKELHSEAADEVERKAVERVTHGLIKKGARTWAPASGLRKLVSHRDRKAGRYEPAVTRLLELDRLEYRDNPEGKGEQYRITPA
ncbi:YfjI family protein [Corynebacterium sp. YIM 101645]|uniref:YfjI family protein n=1 Tax=Corynebacterium lemuris TaxID=1859292 RepID=A0ABT2FT55_9CORY|nr:YfjI family protein [Corynebacterium lemuris]MCS5478409.1 YfjI family protein [Corynebacterium lemuris]